MESTSERDGAVDGLKAQVRGPVLLPGDDGFDEARAVWNCRFDARPDVILRASGAEDVAAGIGWARAHGADLTVKSGGHDYAGNSAAHGGLLLDLSPLGAVEVDPVARTARVGAGARWGAVDAETQRHGLAAVAGTVSSVGVAGFTLGGGEGWLTRKHGLALDNVLSVELVTADGARRTASADENPDLFWGVRGGGANLGVVTAFELRLHELGPEVAAGQVIYPIGDAPRLLRFYRDHFRHAPDELACAAFILRIPPVEPFPEEAHGKLALDFVIGYMGDPGEGEEAIRPFRALGTPILDAVAVQPYTAFQQSFDAGLPPGFRWYTRAGYFDELSDAAIDTLLEGLDPFPGSFTSVYFFAAGGAVGRTAPDAAAYPHRTATHGFHVFPGWEDRSEDETIMSWARGLSAKMAPFSSGGVYVNMLAEDEGARVRDAYGPNYARLAALKGAWDPENVFRRNHNVEPAG